MMGYEGWHGLSATALRVKAAPFRIIIKEEWARLRWARASTRGEGQGSADMHLRVYIPSQARVPGDAVGGQAVR